MQFKDLQKSYQVYILYKGEKIRHKMGTVVSIANPILLYSNFFISLYWEIPQ